MKNKTYRFAAVAAILLTFCLVFMMPAAADSTYTGEIRLPNGVTEINFGENTVTDGTSYYATLDEAVKAIDDAKTSGATLYCKPNSNVGSLEHTPVCSTLTIHGNGATVAAGGERDFDIGNTDPNSGNDVTADMTLTVKNLNGCGAWGNKATEHTVTLIFENCKDMGKIYLTGTTGILNIYLTDCSFTSNDNGGGNCKVYSNANGDISLTGVEFSNVDKAVNLNHKVAGTQTVTITDCTFTNCGDDVSADEIPVRVLSSVDGGISALTISDCTFSETTEGGADILLDYGIGTTSVSISETAAGILVETASNDGTIETITDTETFSQNAVAKIGNVEYLTLQAAINAVQEGETITLLDDVTVTTAAHGDNALNHARAVSFTLDLNIHTRSADTGNSVFRFNIANSGATSDVTVTIKNGEIVAGENTWCAVMSAGIDVAKAILELEDLTIYGNKAGDLAVKAWGNGVVNAERVTIYANNGAGGFYAVGGEITLDECTVVQKGLHTVPYNSMAVAVSNGGTMTVNSGTYSAEPTAAADGYNQGTTHGSWCGGVMNSGGTLIINGGTFTNKNFGEATQATYARGLILADTGANIQINGGTFNALKAIIDTQNNLGDANNQPGALLGGGTFNADPTVASYSQFITLKEGYICLGPTEGKYTVEEANPEITVTPTDGVSSTLEVGYEQPTPQTITVENTGNVELTLTITKTGSDNITVSDLPESQTLAPSDSFEFTIQLDAGLAAGNYEGTITLSNESIENKVIPVSFTVSDPTSEEGVPGTTSPGSTSSSGKDTGSGNFQYYPRSVPADGIIDFGTSPVVTGMEVPVGSSGTVTLNTKPTFAMPENGFYIFEIDAPGYNTEAKINGGIAFKISIAKIEEAGWTENDVVLFHGTVAEDGKITWEALPTNLVKVENGIAYYKAAINGCTPFYIGFVEEGSIVNTEVVDPVTPPTEEPDVPGEILPEIPGVQDEPEEPSSPAPVLGLLAALGAAVVLRRK